MRGCAVGCGHDDGGLQRTYQDVDAVASKSVDGGFRCSDASHWDLSVSTATFWSAYQLHIQRADGMIHRRLVVLNGFFATSWLVSTGETLFESMREGITASGKMLTTNGNYYTSCSNLASTWPLAGDVRCQIPAQTAGAP